MKTQFIFSGVSSYRKRLDERGIIGFNELVSYHELARKKDAFDQINALSEKRGLIMVDSGAWSAFNSAKVIDIDHFISWQKQLSVECPQIYLKAGLDDIGNWQKSKENQQKTDAAGLKLFPTYHRNDPQHYRDWVCSGAYEFVGFGGIASGALTEGDKIAAFLEDAFTSICDSEGRPKIKAHMFGVSNIELVTKYPAYSNDSTSALFTATYGSIWVPHIDGHTGELNWAKPMIHLTVSSESNARGQNNAHFLTLRKNQQEVVRQFVKSYDFDIELIMSSAEERQCFCHIMLMEQANNYPEEVRYKPVCKEFDIFTVA